MIKTYSIYGIVSAQKIFRKANIVKRCEFSGGAVNESSVIPAIYTTNDEITQVLIEVSKEYKDGYIRTESSIEEEKDVKARLEAKKKAEAEAAKKEAEAETTSGDQEGDGSAGSGDDSGDEGVKDYPDVTNTNMAKEILISSHGATPAELQNKTAILAKAAELGVTFSNWR